MSWGVATGIAGAAIRENFEDAVALSARQQDAQPGVKPPQKPRGAYECAGCGAPLFGVINENCQYCKRPIK